MVVGASGGGAASSDGDLAHRRDKEEERGRGRIVSRGRQPRFNPQCGHSVVILSSDDTCRHVGLTGVWRRGSGVEKRDTIERNQGKGSGRMYASRSCTVACLLCLELHGISGMQDVRKESRRSVA